MKDAADPWSTHVAAGPAVIPRFNGLFPEPPDGSPETLCGARGTARDVSQVGFRDRDDACSGCVAVLDRRWEQASLW